MVEVAGFEPASPGDRLGLLRAHPAGRSRLGAPTGRGPLGQPRCDVRRRPPGETVVVSLLMMLDPRPQALRGEQLPNYLGSERVLFVGACVCPAFYETSGISARFPQTINVRVEASTPPYSVVAPSIRSPGDRAEVGCRRTFAGAGARTDGCRDRGRENRRMYLWRGQGRPRVGGTRYRCISAAMWEPTSRMASMIRSMSASVERQWTIAGRNATLPSKVVVPT
jgi:hypothetical protein